VIAHFPVMNSGAPVGISHIALFHYGVNNPVVRTFHALFNAAAQESQGIAQHRASVGDVIQHRHTCKPIGAWWEPLQEMTEQRLMVVIAQHVENEAISHLH
jgi:hypothetical protein